MNIINRSPAIIIALLLSCMTLLSGCLQSPYYQQQTSIPQNAWNYRYMPSFEFEVTDTTCLYDVYFIVRHTNAYPFSNIWMNIHTQQPGDTTFSRQRVNVLLAANSGVNSGQWLGRGMGEIYEHKMRITHEGDSAILNRKGRYVFRFEQNMRINPLPEILQVGLRVEKGKPRNFKAQ
jgi:gliding motility-associated lipoprotein GldH